MTLDDIDEYSCIESKRKEIELPSKGIFECISIGYPILYSSEFKQFTPGNKKILNNNGAFLGWYIKYHDNNLVDVLYRGFLLQDPLKFSLNLQERYLQSYIQNQFEIACNSIIENMPRVKRLKRINLKMITKEYTLYLYRNLDKLIDNYESLYGYEKAMYLKAQITTSPFYINDNGIIKVFDIQTGEFTEATLDSEAYFLAYFTFLNK